MKCLDEGEIKNLCYTIPMVEYDYNKCIVAQTRKRVNESICNIFGVDKPNPHYKRADPSIREFARSVFVLGPETYSRVEEANKHNLEIAEEYGIDPTSLLEYCELDKHVLVPFTPSIMLNISPNWKSQYNIIPDDIDPCEREYLELENLRMVEALCELVESYMAECNRFDYYDYIVECGGEGDFLHAHCVAHVNPKLLKAVIDGSTITAKGKKRPTSHIGKGNHVYQLIKISKGIKGIKGKITGSGIQVSILRKQYLVDDKLAYLHEDKKPVGHKNLYAIWDAPKHVVPGGV